MAQALSRNERIIRVLSALVVLIFAAVLVLRFSPWGAPETGVAEVTQSAIQMDEVVSLTLNLKDGPVELELWPAIAPQHVERVVALAKEGFYDGIVFHRVIDGFMAQTGDPTGTGAGGSDLPDLSAEFSDTQFVRGVLGMARSNSPDSANSQFFIMLDAAPHLNEKYTAFGRVVSGMEHVDALKKGSVANNGLVDAPDSMISLKLNSH